MTISKETQQRCLQYLNDYSLKVAQTCLRKSVTYSEKTQAKKQAFEECILPVITMLGMRPTEFCEAINVVRSSVTIWKLGRSVVPTKVLTEMQVFLESVTEGYQERAKDTQVWDLLLEERYAPLLEAVVAVRREGCAVSKEALYACAQLIDNATKVVPVSLLKSCLSL